MKVMPLMFAFFGLYFPAGLVLYWTASNLASRSDSRRSCSGPATSVRRPSSDAHGGAAAAAGRAGRPNPKRACRGSCRRR